MLKQFIRDKKNNKVGVMVGLQADNKVYIGISKCNTKHDLFDRDLGQGIAIERGVKLRDTHLVDFVDRVSFDDLDKLAGFVNRCERYFKDAEMPTWVREWKMSAQM
jgi:hypothetical protein